MINIDCEKTLLLPSERIMIHQWQEHSYLFQQVAWSTKEGKYSRMIFTVFCMN